MGIYYYKQQTTGGFRNNQLVMTKKMTTTKVQDTLDIYNFQCDGSGDTDNLYFSAENGIDQLHLISFNDIKQLIIHSIVNRDIKVVFQKTYTTIDELTDNLNDWSGGIKF